MRRLFAREDAKSTRMWDILVPLFRGRRIRLAVIAACSIVNGLAEAVVLVLVARVAFALTADSNRVEASLGPLGSIELSVPTMLAIAAVAIVLKLGVQAIIAWQTATVASALTADRRRILTRSFLDAAWDLQSRERQGHLQELSTTYVTQTTLAVVGIVGLGVNTLNLAAMLGSALVLNPVASAVALGTTIVLALALRPLRAATRRRSKSAARANLDYATAVTEVTSGALEVRIFNVEEAVEVAVDREINRHARAQFRTMIVSRIVAPVYQAATLMLIVLALAVVDATGTPRLASLGAIILILLRSLSYSQGAQTGYQTLNESVPYAEQLRSEEDRYRGARTRRDGDPVGRIDEIAFDDVCFEYLPDQPVLRNVSFAARRGEVIGIIGPSGSGKSTLVQLLLRLRQPKTGNVRADGRDAESLSLADWYHHIAFVPQEPRLIAGTVADNIRFFRPVSSDIVVRSAELAHIDDEINAWPDGYETLTGERGGRLSGGQKQRLCIARSLIGEPDVLVLDEPTSALDAVSESAIRETIASLGTQMLVVVIAHRLSTLDVCNRIMVLQEGVVRAFDEPRHLAASNSFYQDALRLSRLK